jgi:hypothetical protein
MAAAIFVTADSCSVAGFSTWAIARMALLDCPLLAPGLVGY